MRQLNKKIYGVTLIEILFVIVILTIFLLYSIDFVRQKQAIAIEAKAIHQIEELQQMARVYFENYNKWPDSLLQLVDTEYPADDTLKRSLVCSPFAKSTADKWEDDPDSHVAEKMDDLCQGKAYYLAIKPDPTPGCPGLGAPLDLPNINNNQGNCFAYYGVSLQTADAKTADDIKSQLPTSTRCPLYDNYQITGLQHQNFCYEPDNIHGTCGISPLPTAARCVVSPNDLKLLPKRVTSFTPRPISIKGDLGKKAGLIQSVGIYSQTVPNAQYPTKTHDSRSNTMKNYWVNMPDCSDPSHEAWDLVPAVFYAPMVWKPTSFLRCDEHDYDSASISCWSATTGNSNSQYPYPLEPSDDTLNSEEGANSTYYKLYVEDLYQSTMETLATHIAPSATGSAGVPSEQGQSSSGYQYYPPSTEPNAPSTDDKDPPVKFRFYTRKYPLQFYFSGMKVSGVSFNDYSDSTANDGTGNIIYFTTCMPRQLLIDHHGYLGISHDRDGHLRGAPWTLHSHVGFWTNTAASTAHKSAGISSNIDETYNFRYFRVYGNFAANSDYCGWIADPEKQYLWDPENLNGQTNDTTTAGIYCGMDTQSKKSIASGRFYQSFSGQGGAWNAQVYNAHLGEAPYVPY